MGSSSIAFHPGQLPQCLALCHNCCHNHCRKIYSHDANTMHVIYTLPRAHVANVVLPCIDLDKKKKKKEVQGVSVIPSWFQLRRCRLHRSILGGLYHCLCSFHRIHAAHCILRACANELAHGQIHPNY